MYFTKDHCVWTTILHTVIGLFSIGFIIIILKPPGNQTTCNDPQQMSKNIFPEYNFDWIDYIYFKI